MNIRKIYEESAIGLIAFVGGSIALYALLWLQGFRDFPSYIGLSIIIIFGYIVLKRSRWE